MRRGKYAAGAAVVFVGTGLAREGAALILGLHRHEHVELPAPLRSANRTIDGLVAYTGLEPGEVRAQVRGHIESYRAEWHLLPWLLHLERWYYLS